MTDLLDLSERILRGEASIDDHHPFRPSNVIGEVGEGIAMVESFANVAAVRTGEGLVLVDTGSPFAAPTVHERIRSWDTGPAHTAIYTHGHIDHVFGTGPFEAEASERGDPPLRVVAHEDVDPRFDRYVTCAGYNEVVNQRQFRAPGLRWPTDFRRPDLTYRDRLDLTVGGLDLELHHARGETDDATWVWIPERGAVGAGDMVIWCAPNAGNPQKVQRYPIEWAAALRAMIALEPELVVPAHGLPFDGRDRIAAVIGTVATTLERLADEVLAMMNAGATLDEIIHTVHVPEETLAKPYLRPLYDEPEFVVRNLWRQFGGWWDGAASRLKPARDAELGAVVAELAGGTLTLARRAAAEADAGNLRLACHLADLAAWAAPDDGEVHAVRADIYTRRRDAERSLMAKGIYAAAARESEEITNAAGDA